mmetsp:Transcript_18646/g.34564  ORF Transcript_18646/g.34564 Transcript_18646/m.34564 type:complete len:337 (+) Transcript_18646:164-1174(+)
MSGLELLIQAATVRPSLINPSNSSERNRNLSHSHLDIITSQSSHSNNNNFSKTSRCASSTSLPPKKRMKISFQATDSSGGNHGGGSNTNESFRIQSDSSVSSLGMSVMSSSTYGSGGHIDSPSTNSEWTETMATKVRNKTNATNSFLNISYPLVEPKRNKKKDQKKNGTSSSTRKSSTHGLKRQLSSTSSLKSSATSSKTTDELSVKDVDGNDMCMGYFSMPSRMSSSSSSKSLTTMDARKKLPTIRHANEEELNHHRLPARQVKLSPQRPQYANQQDTTPRLPTVNEIMYQPLLTDTKTSLRGVPDRFGNLTGWIEEKPLLYQAFLQALNQHQNC